MDKLTEKVAKALCPMVHDAWDECGIAPREHAIAMARAALRVLRRENPDTLRLDWLNRRCRDVYADRASKEERWILAGSGCRWHSSIRLAIDSAIDSERAERKARGGGRG